MLRRPWFWALLVAMLAWALWSMLVLRAPQEEAGLSVPTDASTVARGAYLARLGNCAQCHTARGGASYAGGLGIDTPFGTVFSSNITPDRQHGIGTWSAQDFWRALHAGESRDGHWLTPAFPYTNYTHVTRSDADALYAYLMSLPASDRANTPHTLRWPYRTQAALGVWRALFFTPDQDAERAAPQGAEATTPALRGAYLVQGLGHCSACHTDRNALGAIDTSRALSGGMIPAQDWYAPSLRDGPLSAWTEADVMALLQTGTTPHGNALGPMAEVVRNSTQYLSNADARAVAVYLQSLPAGAPQTPPRVAAPGSAVTHLGAGLYDRHCAQCHGPQGQGVPGAYPALVDNHTVNAQRINNLVQVVWHGGFAPATAANPRPYGMPPFQLLLNDQELAALLSYVRSAWGNSAATVSEFDINQLHQRAGR